VNAFKLRDKFIQKKKEVHSVMIDKICMTFFLLWNTKEGNLNNVDYFNVQCSN